MVNIPWPNSDIESKLDLKKIYGTEANWFDFIKVLSDVNLSVITGLILSE